MPASRILLCAALLLAMTAMGAAAHAGAEPWDPRSTDSQPCGIGTPPPGHVLRELGIPTGGAPLALTVRQDGDRLCYVADGIAEAPVIRLRQGDRLALTLKNEITDPAAIENFLPGIPLARANNPVPARDTYYPVVGGTHHVATGATNLHFHGFAVPPVAPQDEVMMTCADPASGPAQCGRRAIDYVVEIPRSMPAGLYWYHPHFHGETQAQVEMGLLGAIVVEGPADDARRAAGIRDRVLLIGQTRPPGTAVPAGKADAAPVATIPAAALRPPLKRQADVPADRIDADHEVSCGPPGDRSILTLNGTPVAEGPTPDDALPTVTIASGRQELWRLVDGADESYLNLALVDGADHPLPLSIVARDGAPRADDAGRPLPPEISAAPQLLPPAGRIEFLVAAPPPGAAVYLVSRAVDTGCVGEKVPPRKLVRIVGGVAEPTPAPPAQEAARNLASVPSLFSGILAHRTDRKRAFALTEYPRPGNADETDYYITELKPDAEIRPFDMSAPPAVTVRAGTVEEWTIQNWTRELHAFHIHQLHFRVLSVNGVAVADPELVDTVDVPYARQQVSFAQETVMTPGEVTIKLAFPATLAGDIPFHCHILEHEDNGMMAILRVLGDRDTRRAQSRPVPDIDKPQICGPSRQASSGNDADGRKIAQNSP